MGVPIQEQPGQFKKVSIGSNSWIGNGAIVMANVGIQNVIAAGCVIAAPTGDYEVWGGNPGVLIKRIDDF
jgi:acetyltransferase-like isoleucine patch superfamily enzyme